LKFLLSEQAFGRTHGAGRFRTTFSLNGIILEAANHFPADIAKHRCSIASGLFLPPTPQDAARVHSAQVRQQAQSG
jgi:hypothetical protein